MKLQVATAKPHGRRYPWDRWLIDRVVTLRRGRDYDCEPASMGIVVRLAARRHGRLVRVQVAGDTVVIEPLGG